MSLQVFRQTGQFARNVKFQLPNKMFETPMYFPSVSSYGTDKVINYVNFLIDIKHPYMLLSAYDFFHIFESKPELVKKINNFSSNGNFLFVDSGGYEQKWNEDKAWDFDVYKNTISKINSDIYTSLDFMESKVDKEASFDRIKKSYPLVPNSQFMPIFDGTTPKELISNIQTFMKKSPEYSIKFLAVRERDCGVSITEKASTIFNIRKNLDLLKQNCILHVLGCGNPLNIVLYSFFGADSFDSRDWFLKTIDIDNLLLRDFSHLELLDCKCETCKKSEKIQLDPYSKTIAHNIKMYLDFMKKLQKLIKENSLESFLKSSSISNKILKKIQY